MEPIYLRALEVEDLDRTYKWHNDQGMYRTMGGVFHYVSRATEEEWLRRKQTFAADEVNLAICLQENRQHVGNIYLRNIDWLSRNAELQIWIGEPEFRSQGYGFSAHKILQDYAFNDLGLQRLYVYILESNFSIKLAKKFGFIVEGRLRKQVFIDGQFKDIVVMGRCVDDDQSGYDAGLQTGAITK